MKISEWINTCARNLMAAMLAVVLVAPGVSAQEEEECPNIVYCGEGYTTVYGSDGCAVACTKTGPEFIACSADGSLACPEGQFCCDTVLFNQGYPAGDNLFCADNSRQCLGLVNPWQRWKEQNSP